MLQGIRDRAQGWIAWVIVILISIPFALWGVYEYLGGNPNVPVAEVNGVELPIGQFRQAHRRQRMHLQNLFGANFDLGVLDERAIKRSTLSDLIDGEVLLQAGIGNGLRIGDRQLAEAIRARPMFHEEGRFSEAIYQRWLRMFGYTAGGFEQEYRRSLLIDQIERAIADTALVGARDVGNTLRLQGQKRRVSLLTIPRARYRGNEIAEEAIVDYHQRNQARFVTPERVSVRYLELSLGDLPDIPEPAEEVLRDLYERREAGYAEVEGDRASAESGAVRPFEEVRGELLEDLERQQKEQLFFDTAEQLADLTFENPDTLAVAADILGLAIEETGFFDRAGSPIEEAPPPGAASDEAPDRTSDDKTPGPSPAAASPVAFSPGAAMPTRDRKFVTAAFSEDVLNVGNNSGPIELGEHRVIVLRRKAHLPASPRPLEAVRDQVTALVDTERAQERVIELGDRLIEELRNGATLASVADAHGLTPREPTEIGRDDGGRGHGIAPEIVDRAFRMPRPPTDGGTVYDGRVVGTGDYVVIGLREVIEKEPADADTAIEAATRDTLARAHGNEEYRAYIRTLRAGAAIRIHEENL